MPPSAVTRAKAPYVTATYKLLVSKEAARLTEEAAPKLHEYLTRRERRDLKKSGDHAGAPAGDEDDHRPFSP